MRKSFSSFSRCSDNESESGQQHHDQQKRNETSEATRPPIVTGTAVHRGPEPEGTDRMRMMMDVSEAGAGSESRSCMMMSGAEASSVRSRSEAMSRSETGMIPIEMHIVSHHCSLPPIFFRRQKKTFAAVTAKVLLSHLGRTLVGVTVAKYACGR